MIRVLVAEDHTIVREGIKQLIGLAKDLVVAGEACNGEQLLETLRHTPCEVVLLDISMPGVNGLEAIPRIRALTHPPAVLVLSMHDEAQMAARALKIGAAGYATKDSDPALLLTAIRKVAAGGRYIGTIGGQVEFVRGTRLSPGGVSVIALPATQGEARRTRIVPALSGPVTTPRSDVDHVVTEFGAVRLRGLSIAQRARALISIADPAHREALERAAFEGARRSAPGR